MCGESRYSSAVSPVALEKRFNAMELSTQRQLQQRDREISALKMRVSDLEDALASIRGMLVFMGAV